jgi:FMN phosphatase YigB (HAD superfamily)
MSIKAVVFDIGGVLEVTPSLGVTDMWESRLGLDPGEINKRMSDIWQGGGIGTVSQRDVHTLACERLQVKPAQMVFLDDYEPCVEGGRRTGIHAVLYQDNAQAINDIEHLLAL